VPSFLTVPPALTVYMCTQLQGQQEATTKEYYLTVHLSSSPPQDPASATRDGASAATCTRCLRMPTSSHSAEVNETFLLEIPDATARALAHDVTADITSRRLNVVNKQAPKLTCGTFLSLLLHDLAAPNVGGALLAHGNFELTPSWLFSAAQCSLRDPSATSPDVNSVRDVRLECVQPLGSSSASVFAFTSAVVGVRVQLQRVRAWIDDAPSAHEILTSRSQRGFRSLRLAAPGAEWLPVVRDGMQHTATGSSALSGGVLGLDIGSGVALEESFVRGVRQEMIRSTVQVENNLDFPVLVRRSHPLRVWGRLQATRCVRNLLQGAQW
jgi:hypothetical protein